MSFSCLCSCLPCFSASETAEIPAATPTSTPVQLAASRQQALSQVAWISFQINPPAAPSLEEREVEPIQRAADPVVFTALEKAGLY